MASNLMLTRHLIGFAARPQAAHVAHRIQRVVGRRTERLQLPLPLQPATRAAAGGAGAILPTAPDAPEPHEKQSFLSRPFRPEKRLFFHLSYHVFKGFFHLFSSLFIFLKGVGMR